MSVKEITVFIIGIMLVGFIYLMKLPQDNISPDIIAQTDKITQTQLTNQQISDFDPNTAKPILDRILDVPAWTFDISSIGALTLEEIIKSIEMSIDDNRFFEPENNNALFYMVNLKILDENNDKIDFFNQILTNELNIQSEMAIFKNDEKDLKLIIALYKTLDTTSEMIQSLPKKLSTISTINKLYKKGIQQISNELIVAEDSEDAWHTAKLSLEVDPENSKTQSLISKIINILINDALRAAEEIDFQLALNHIEYAELLSPNELAVEFTRNKIFDLKQQRYIWLEAQLSNAIKKLNIDRANRMISQLEDLGLEQLQLISYRYEVKRIEIFGKYSDFDVFSDVSNNNDKFPKMVVMPLGQYIMGNNKGPKHEKPEHIINIDYGFAVSQNEISVSDFELFIQSSDYKTDAKTARSSRIYDLRTGRIKNKNRVTWKDDYIGKKADDNLPVIHVSWNDAIAYTKWISEQTGKNYRLLSESEFEYILRAGSRTLYPWGDGNPIQIIENLTGKLDRTTKNTRIRWKKGFDKYNDKYWGPAPVASFLNNQFRLNDTAGNVMEWVMDCWHDSYVRAPIDGSSWINLGCENHVIRGGSWSSSLREYSSSHRFIAKSNFTDARLGFRIAVNLKPN